VVIANQAAPSLLEEIRTLLNTEWIPNDTRERRDDFDDYSRRRRLTRSEAKALKRLRSDLRAAVKEPATTDEVLNRALRRLGVSVALKNARIAFHHHGGRAGELLIIVLEAMRDHQWHRLKACPDCEWVFYDHSRNGSKRWCVMTAESEGGRSCGTLAKVRAFRARAKA
jgi:hypothetical protein